MSDERATFGIRMFSMPGLPENKAILMAEEQQRRIFADAARAFPEGFDFLMGETTLEGDAYVTKVTVKPRIGREVRPEEIAPPSED